MNEAQKTLVFYVLVLAASVGTLVILFIVANSCRDAYAAAIPASRRASLICSSTLTRSGAIS